MHRPRRTARAVALPRPHLAAAPGWFAAAFAVAAILGGLLVAS